MEVTKQHIAPSFDHVQLMKKTEEALKRVAAGLVNETKALNSYLVVSDPEGSIKKIPAKEL